MSLFAGNAWILVRFFIRLAQPKYPQQQIGLTSQLATGEVKLFNYPTANDPCIMVKTPSGKLAAYSQKCTHVSCAVYYEKAENRLACPCHGGFFSVEDGTVLQGPPRRPLPLIQIEQRGDELFARGVIENREKSA